MTKNTNSKMEVNPFKGCEPLKGYLASKDFQTSIFIDQNTGLSFEISLLKFI